MNVGIRAHDLGRLPIDDLAKKASDKGFTAVQLALAKALPDLNSALGCLSPGFAYQVGSVFKKHNVQIAVLGCYINPVDPDKDERRKALDRFKEHIRYARDFGCSIVATETGSMNSDMSFTTENHGEEAFKIITESVRELVQEAEKFGVLVGIEGVTVHTINTPKRMKRLLDEINSNNMQVVLDPVNFIDIDNYKNQDEIIQEAFELFGDRIVIIHAKDFIIEDGKVKSVPAGKGMLNYELLAKLLKSRKQFINVLLEDAQDPANDESLKFLKEVYERV